MSVILCATLILPVGVLVTGTVNMVPMSFIGGGVVVGDNNGVVVVVVVSPFACVVVEVKVGLPSGVVLS